MTTSRKALERALAEHGLRLRGSLRPTPQDALPALPGGAVAAVLWLVGQVGSECWPAFSASGFFADGLPDPMDRWSQSIGDALAQLHGGIALYPTDGPPYRPFQRWAERAEALQPSPLGLRIHPQWGLWHAYRFALLLPASDADDTASLVAAPEAGYVASLGAAPEAGYAPGLEAGPQAAFATDICARCVAQPCLHACPVDAFGATGYDVAACAGHLRGPDGAPCMQGGCLARRACPVGSGLRYLPEHAAFHMRAYLRRR